MLTVGIIAFSFELVSRFRGGIACLGFGVIWYWASSF